MNKTRTLTAILLSGLSLMAAACNTVGGVGQDIESTGEAIERASQ